MTTIQPNVAPAPVPPVSGEDQNTASEVAAPQVESKAAERGANDWIEELPQLDARTAQALLPHARTPNNIQTDGAPNFDLTAYKGLGPDGIRKKAGIEAFGTSLSDRAVDKDKAKTKGIDYQDGATVGTIAAQQFGKVIENELKNNKLDANSDAARAKKLMDAQAALDSGYDLYGYAEAINAGSGTYRETSKDPTRLTGDDVKQILNEDSVSQQLSELMSKPDVAERYRKELSYAAQNLLPDGELDQIQNTVNGNLFNSDGSNNTKFEESVIAQTAKANEGSPDNDWLNDIDADVANQFEALNVLDPEKYASRKLAFNQNLTTYQLNDYVAKPEKTSIDAQALGFRTTVDIVQSGVNGVLQSMDKSDKTYEAYKDLRNQLSFFGKTDIPAQDKATVRQAIADASASRDASKIDQIADKVLKNLTANREETAGATKKLLHSASKTGTLGALSGTMSLISGAVQIGTGKWSEMSSEERAAAARDLVGGLSFGSDFARFGSNMVEKASKVAGADGTPKFKATEWLGLMSDNFPDIWGKNATQTGKNSLSSAIGNRVEAGSQTLADRGADGAQLSGDSLNTYNDAAAKVGRTMGVKDMPDVAKAVGRSFLRFTFGAGLDMAGGVMDIVSGVSALRRANTALERAGASLQITGGSGTAGMGVASMVSMLVPKETTLVGNYVSTTALSVVRGLAAGARVLGPALGGVGAVAGFAGMLIAEAIQHAKLQKLTDGQGKFFHDIADMGAAQEDWGDKLEYARYASYMYGGRDTPQDQTMFDFQADEWKHFQETEGKDGSSLYRLAPYLHRDGDPDSKNNWERSGTSTFQNGKDNFAKRSWWRPWGDTDIKAGAPGR